MSYVSTLKNGKRSQPKTLADVLREISDVELVKWHSAHSNPNIIPVRYKGKLFEFINESGNWKLLYLGVISENIYNISHDHILKALNEILCFLDTYEPR